jgi:hypothetical protein
MSYSYSPQLDPARHEIRLLRIHPGKDASDLIELTVYHTTIERAGDYLALSYAWGANPESKRPVVLNGTDFAVAENLHSALQHIRLPEEELTIWIDAICINQDDTTEREGQVRQMRDIFGRAKEVLAWIGPEVTGEEGNVFHFIEIMAQMTPDKAEQLLGGRRRLPHTMTWDSLVSMTAPGFSTSVWLGVVELLERRWFSRVWVIQEVVMGMRVSIICGKHRLCWDVLFDMAKSVDLTVEFISDLCMFSYDITMRLQCSTSVYLDWVEQSPLTRLARAMNYVFAIGRGRENRLALERKQDDRSCMVNSHAAPKHTAQTLFDVVSEYQTFNSTLDLDKVYALLGVAIASDQVSEVVTVDYSLSMLDLYWKVLELGLKNGGHLDFLGNCNGVSSPHGIPSWMPLWYAQTKQPIAMRRLAQKNNLLFQTSADLKPHYRFDRTTKTLYLKATFVSRIKQLGQESIPQEPARTIDTNPNFEDPAPRQWVDMLGLNEPMTSRCQPPFTGEKFLESMKGVHMTEKEQLWINFFRTLEMNYAGPCAETIDLFLNLPLDEAESSPRDRRFHLSQVLGRRRLFVSEQRNTFGLCPGDSQLGDEIAIIHGAKVPFVVRRAGEGGAYTVVGPSFVAQLMDGSFLKALQASKQLSNGGSGFPCTWHGAQFSVRIPGDESGMVGFV